MMPLTVSNPPPEGAPPLRHLLPYPWTSVTDEIANPDRVLERPNPVLLIEVLPAHLEILSGLQDFTSLTRRQHTGFPLVLWCRNGADSAPKHRAERFSAARGIRAVIYGAEIEADAIRSQLVDPTGLGSDVAQWCIDVGLACAGQGELLVRDLVDATSQGQTLARISRLRGQPQRTLQAAFSRHTLLTAGEIVSLAVRLRTALQLQQETDSSADNVGARLGFTPSGFRKHFRRTFGVDPAAIARLLGIAPLLMRWAERRENRTGHSAQVPAKFGTGSSTLDGEN